MSLASLNLGLLSQLLILSCLPRAFIPTTSPTLTHSRRRHVLGPLAVRAGRFEDKVPRSSKSCVGGNRKSALSIPLLYFWITRVFCLSFFAPSSCDRCFRFLLSIIWQSFDWNIKFRHAPHFIDKGKTKYPQSPL